jgi:hypothetical protein
MTLRAIKEFRYAKHRACLGFRIAPNKGTPRQIILWRISLD